MNANIDGIQIGQISASGELIAYYWGKAFPTGIIPQIVRKSVNVERNVFSIRRSTAVEIKAARHVKNCRNGDVMVTVIVDDLAVVNMNKIAPRVVTVAEAREIWKSE